MQTIPFSHKSDFDFFLTEIDAHFQMVLAERLGWAEPREVKFKVGAGNVVIRFRHDDEYFIFRVPKYSRRQIRSYLLAYNHFSSFGLMAEKVYHDERCVIERFLPGYNPLSGQFGEQDLKLLALSLRRLHQIPAEGFDRIIYNNCGQYKKLSECFSSYVEKGLSWLEEQNVLDKVRLQHLRSVMSNHNLAAEPVCVICHGDMSAANILIDRDAVRFIDWDGICAFPREYDFSYLNVDPGFRKWMDDLISYYGLPLNRELIDYFSFGNILRTLCTVNDPFRELGKFNDIFENLLLQIPISRK